MARGHGLSSLEGGEDELRDFYTARITAPGGDVAADDRAERIIVRSGRLGVATYGEEQITGV